MHANLEIDAEVTLRINAKKNYSIGKAEFYDCSFVTFVNHTNMTKIGLWLQTLNCSEMYINTNYGLGRYRSSPYVINTANWVVVDILNEGYAADMMTFDLNSFTGGLFNITEPFINYYDGYIGIGMSADFTNNTFLKNQTKPVVKLTNAFGESGEWVVPEPFSLVKKQAMEEIDRQIGLQMMQ